MQSVYSASKIFTGEEWLDDQAIIIEDGIIQSVIPRLQLPDVSNTLKHYQDLSIIPGFIDAQVYGAGGRLFAAYPDVETLKLMQKIFLKAR